MHTIYRHIVSTIVDLFWSTTFWSTFWPRSILSPFWAAFLLYEICSVVHIELTHSDDLNWVCESELVSENVHKRMFVRKTSARDKHLSSKRVIWTKQLEEWRRWRRRFTPIYQCGIGIDSRLSAMADNFVKRMTSYLPFVNSPWTTNKMARYFLHIHMYTTYSILHMKFQVFRDKQNMKRGLSGHSRQIVAGKHPALWSVNQAQSLWLHTHGNNSCDIINGVFQNALMTTRQVL